MASGILQQPAGQQSTRESARPITAKMFPCRPGSYEQFAEARGWSLVSRVRGRGNQRQRKTNARSSTGSCPTPTRRSFDVVVCWRFDRFARSVSHLLRALETFNALGHRLCQSEREHGHHDAHRQDDIHRSRGRGRVGAQLDRGACPGRAAERPRQGKDAGQAA